MSADACPSDDEILALLAGQLPAERLDDLRRHIGGCVHCCAALAALDSVEGRSGSAQPSAAASSNPEALAMPAAFDEFRVLRPLGRGAMGQVYLGHDTLLDRRVAIKFLAPRQQDDSLRERFLVEARAIARLQHPNVVAVHRFGEVQGLPYLVSEFIHGTSLDLLPKPAPREQALHIGLSLARGLGEAHRRGVLHRDIKPANAILAHDGQVKLLDFGLAKVLELGGSLADSLLGRDLSAPMGQEMTGAGVVLGTPLYLAPELWRGEPATRRSDLYSLGALLYELCSGQLPHCEKSIAALRQAAIERDARPLAEVAPGAETRLAQVVDQCLRRDPAARPPSCEALCQVLERLTPAQVATPVAEGNPYRGLLPFEAAHRSLFFGRAAEVSEILDRLRGGPLVLVSGSSGAGKSSLCRAGVVPLVEEGALSEGRKWRSGVLVPGRRPLSALGDVLASALELGAEFVMPLLQQPSAELGRALRRKLGAERGLLLFIDQMEELLTQSDAVEAVLAGEVLGLLAERIPGVRVLMTVRGDYFTRLIEVIGLADELAQGLFVLRSLSEDGLREAIEGPARMCGVAFESAAMVTVLVESTAQAEGGLPLLQFALAQLWEGRDEAKQVISAQALEEIGGVAGALAQHADGVVGRLGAAHSRAARRILLRLVTLEGTRARRQESELLTGAPEEGPALEALVRGRLVVAREGDGYEVAHEALVAGWETLRGWLAADVDGRTLRDRLEEAAAEWERLGHGREVLWSQVQLREVEVLAPEPAELLPRAVAFLAASRKEATRRQQTRRGVMVAMLCLPLLLLLIGQQWRTARRERERAKEIDLERLGVHAENLAQLRGQGASALVAAIHASAPSLSKHDIPSVSAMLGLSAAVSSGRRSLSIGHYNVLAASFSPDGDSSGGSVGEVEP